MADSRRIVVKIGGNALGPEDTTFDDLVAVQREGIAPLVVHGGGPLITQWLDRLGIESTFARGLRVTDEKALDVIIAVLSGLVNKRIVAAIGAAGGRAVGLSGADGPSIFAEVRDAELGRVGEVSGVRPDLINGLMSHDFIPVFSPVSVDAADEGKLLNVNADSVAGALAGALGAERVIFLTDVPGVLDADGAVISELTASQAQSLIADGVITGGMIPKVTACLNALAHAGAAHIIDGRAPGALRRALADEAGTRIIGAGNPAESQLEAASSGARA